jgi:hypothetical protein
MAAVERKQTEHDRNRRALTGASAIIRGLCRRLRRRTSSKSHMADDIGMIIGWMVASAWLRSWGDASRAAH